ncbi:MAG: hypothetical protein AB1529_03575 [Candidatus Micrarchaeota archaeon]
MGAQAGLQAGGPAGMQAAQQVIMNNYFNMGTPLPQQLESIRTAFQRLGPNPTPAQIETALTQLYNVLRVGGTLGLTYLSDAGREPRAPGAVLSRRSGDCDELATTFIAAAMRLGIPLTGVRFAGIDFTTGRPGSAATVPHAVLFVTVNNHNFVFDMTQQAPTPVRDFSEATIGGLYSGRSISYGPANHSPNLTGIGTMVLLPTAADVVAGQLVIRAGYFDAQAHAASGTARAAAFAQAIPALADASALGSTIPFINARLRGAALNVFGRVEEFAEKEHDAKRYASAITHYRAALSLLQAIPILRASKGTREFDIRKSLADACRKSGRNSEALAEYDAMMRLRPSDPSAYVSAYELNIALYKGAKSARDRTAHLTRAYVVLRIVANSTSVDAELRARITAQRATLERHLRSLGVDPASITIPRSP